VSDKSLYYVVKGKLVWVVGMRDYREEGRRFLLWLNGRPGTVTKSGEMRTTVSPLLIDASNEVE
jgi:hypothetical protein